MPATVTPCLGQICGHLRLPLSQQHMVVPRSQSALLLQEPVYLPLFALLYILE